MEDLENMMQPTQVDVDASYEDLENIISSQFTMTNDDQGVWNSREM